MEDNFKVLYTEQVWTSDYIRPEYCVHRCIAVPVGWMEEFNCPLYLHFKIFQEFYVDTGEFIRTHYYRQYHKSCYDHIRTNPPKSQKIYDDLLMEWDSIVFNHYPELFAFQSINRAYSDFGKTIQNPTIVDFLMDVWEGRFEIRPKNLIFVPTEVSSRYR